MHRQRDSRWRALALVLALAATAACGPGNIFSIPASAGATGPEVTLLAPSPGAVLAPGEDVQVRANVTAPEGLVRADYVGAFVSDGTAAFVADSEIFGGATATTLDNTLEAVPDVGGGDVRIIVTVTDGAGEVAADTVTVTIS